MTTGTTATTFAPQGTMTRAEFITMLSRLNGNSDYGNHPNSTGYTDNFSGWYYTPHINWASEYGIVDTAEGDTLFRTGDAITREEVAIFLAKYVDVLGVTLAGTTEASARFGDVGDISEGASYYVELVRKYGLIFGDDKGYFNPQNTLTRAEAYTVAMRVREMLQDAASNDDFELPAFVEMSHFDICEIQDGIRVGEAFQMYISKWYPADCTVREVTWSLWDGSAEIAVITEDGLLTGISEGWATIYAAHANGQIRITQVFIHAT